MASSMQDARPGCSTGSPVPAAAQVALDLFETRWDDLIGQPSSVSAAPDVRSFP